MYCEHCGLQIMPQRPVCTRCGVSPTYHWVQLTGLLVLLLALVLNALVAWFLLARLNGKTPATGGLVLAASAGSVSFFGIPIVRALFGPNEARVAVYFAVPGDSALTAVGGSSVGGALPRTTVIGIGAGKPGRRISRGTLSPG